MTSIIPLQTNRKGVSPLIAAVLLIAFTMAVAAILTAWVTTFTQEQTGAVGNQSQQIIKCSGGVLQILDTSSDSNQLNITLANVGSVDLSNVTITALGGGNVVGSSFTGPFATGDTTSRQLTLSGTAEQVRVAAQNCPSVAVSQNNP